VVLVPFRTLRLPRAVAPIAIGVVACGRSGYLLTTPGGPNPEAELVPVDLQSAVARRPIPVALAPDLGDAVADPLSFIQSWRRY
jgi:hypothetical protein